MKKQNGLSANISIPFLPRVLRAKTAHLYLGMSRDVFNQEVKPFVTVIPIGRQGIGYDRLELDAWLEHYKHRNGRPATQFLGGRLCQNQDLCQGSSYEVDTGTSTSVTHSSPEGDFAKALALVKKTSTSRKRV